MKKSQGRNLIYDALQEIVAEYAFRLNRKQEGFVRRISDGKQWIGVPLFDYNPLYIWSLTFTTRLNAVEAIFNLFSGSPPKYHLMTTTTITQLDYFTKKPNTEYRATTERDISDAVHDLTPIVRAEILPFLDEHQDVIAWDKAVNSESNDVCCDSSLLTDSCKSVDNSNHPYRGMHAVILAYLARNPRFDEIVRRLLDFYKESKEATDKLTRLLAYLRQQKTSALPPVSKMG